MLRDAGIITLGTATHLLEAIVLEESHVDFIIAQGAEAGGHRGTFVGHRPYARGDDLRRGLLRALFDVHGLLDSQFDPWLVNAFDAVGRAGVFEGQDRAG